LPPEVVADVVWATVTEVMKQGRHSP
jgi:hypothetical protein